MRKRLFVSPSALAVAASLFVLVAAPGSARAAYISAEATCVDGDSTSFRWTFHDDPQYPTGHPEWVGYDVLRRTVFGCGPFVRVNDEPIPRDFSGTHSRTFTEAAPANGEMFQYQLVKVDANRQPVLLGPTCWPCFANGWASCPEFSAPLTHGTLWDQGWAIFVDPCPSSCYQGFYFSGSPWDDELRALAGTGTAVRLYGSEACGTVEGCAMQVERYEIAPCIGPTPARTSSWGQVKIRYR